MPAITVNVAVIHENQILLTKRGDFEIWCLPSGGVEEGESVAQAAIRETKEETGLDVELKSRRFIVRTPGADRRRNCRDWRQYSCGSRDDLAIRSEVKSKRYC